MELDCHELKGGIYCDKRVAVAHVDERAGDKKEREEAREEEGAVVEEGEETIHALHAYELVFLGVAVAEGTGAEHVRHVLQLVRVEQVQLHDAAAGVALRDERVGQLVHNQGARVQDADAGGAELPRIIAERNLQDGGAEVLLQQQVVGAVVALLRPPYS